MAKKDKSSFGDLKAFKVKKKALMQVSEDDKQLFRHAVKDVKEIHYNRVLLDAKDLKKSHEIYNPQNYNENYQEEHKNLRSETLHNLKFGTEVKGIYSISSHPHEKYVRNGISEKVLKKIRQQVQNYAVPEIDLHGYTIESAHATVINFIGNRFNQGSRVVKIIHGKGLQSATGDGVLKYEVRKWLMHLNCVLAYFPAPDKHGGHGALIIYLANQK